MKEREDRVGDNKSLVYKAIDAERTDFYKNKQEISIATGHATSNGNLWYKLKLGTIGFHFLCKICNVCGLEIIIRNPRRNSQYVVNNPETNKTIRQQTEKPTNRKTTNNEEVSKWDWMMNYCKNKGISSAQKSAWDEAEIEYNKQH